MAENEQDLRATVKACCLFAAMAIVVATARADTPTVDVFHDASAAYRQGDAAKAATGLRHGAAMVEGASRGRKGAAEVALVTSAKELLELARDVEARTLEGEDPLKEAFARAEHALAQADLEAARRAFSVRNRRQTGRAMAAALAHLERAAEWAGEGTDTRGLASVVDSHGVADELARGMALDPEIVNRELEVLDAEVERLAIWVRPARDDGSTVLLFHAARASYLRGDRASAARAIRLGAAILVSDARDAYGPGHDLLSSSVHELAELAGRIAGETIDLSEGLDGAFFRAHRAMASFHHGFALASRVRGNLSRAGQEVAAAVMHLDAALAWRGGAVEPETRRLLSETRSLARRMLEGAGYLPQEVARVVDAIGWEVGRLTR